MDPPAKLSLHSLSSTLVEDSSPVRQKFPGLSSVHVPVDISDNTLLVVLLELVLGKPTEILGTAVQICYTAIATHLVLVELTLIVEVALL